MPRRVTSRLTTRGIKAEVGAVEAGLELLREFRPDDVRPIELIIERLLKRNEQSSQFLFTICWGQYEDRYI